MRNYLVALFFLIALLSIMLNPNKYQDVFRDILSLWVSLIVPSLVPLFIISNILYAYPFISWLSYPLLKYIFHFESQKSCSIFLLSIIAGQPTVSILIQKAMKANSISIQEANRIMRFSSHLSPLFILAFAHTASFPTYAGLLILSSQIGASLIIAMLSKGTNVKIKKEQVSTDKDFSYLLDECPIILLRILMIMILVSLIRFPLLMFIPQIRNSLVLNYFIDSFEITTGLSSIIKYDISLINKIPLISFTISITGICIILQVAYAIKKTSLKLVSYLKFRIIHGLISAAICYLVLILIFLT